MKIYTVFYLIDDWNLISDNLEIYLDGIGQGPIYKQAAFQNYCGWEHYKDEKREIVY